MRNNPLSFFPDSFPFQVYCMLQTIWWSTDSEYLDRAKIFGEKSVGRMKEEALTDTEKLKSLIFSEGLVGNHSHVFIFAGCLMEFCSYRHQLSGINK